MNILEEKLQSMTELIKISVEDAVRRSASKDPPQLVIPPEFLHRPAQTDLKARQDAIHISRQLSRLV